MIDPTLTPLRDTEGSEEEWQEERNRYEEARKAIADEKDPQRRRLLKEAYYAILYRITGKQFKEICRD